MKYHNFTKIIELKSNEVFVFGSNNSGFHGAGSAGFAFKGNTRNDWRDNPLCQAAIEASKMHSAGLRGENSPRIGKWAIWGVGHGFMEGKEGKSYAIVTTERPGYQGNVNLETIEKELILLSNFAKNRPDLVFLCVPFGLSRRFGGFSWFSLDEIKNLLNRVEKTFGFPDNVLLPEKFK